MKKTLITLLSITFSSLVYSQVGINTPNPLGTLHVDGAKDNPETGAPSADEAANDVVVTRVGNIGVGITSPLGRFHLYNPVTGNNIGDDYLFDDESAISNTHGLFLRRSNAGANLAQNSLIGSVLFNPKVNGAFGYGGTGISGIYRGNGTNQLNALTFLINNNNEAARIDENGNMGIGTTAPAAKLDIVGDTFGVKRAQGSGSWDNIWFDISNTSAPSINASGAETGLQFKVGANATGTYGDAQTLATVATMRSNGNVGIGTTAPAERLSVVDAGNANQFQGTASFWANNLTRGVGIGYGGIQAIGSLANADLNLNAKATGNIIMQTQATGNVGIGTGAPIRKLHIEGSQYINATITTATTKNAIDINIGQDGIGYGNRTDNYGILMRSNSGSALAGNIARINFGDEHPISVSGIKYLSFSVGQGTGNELMYLTSNGVGLVGIGTTSPTQKLHVIGNILASGTITPSDIRIKKDIVDNTYGLKEILNLRTINYKYKDEELSKDKKIGFVAQEVKAIIPELVTTANDEMKTLGVNYAEMTVVLTKAVQEQQKMIKNQQTEINELKALIKEMQLKLQK